MHFLRRRARASSERRRGSPRKQRRREVGLGEGDARRRRFALRERARDGRVGIKSYGRIGRLVFRAAETNTPHVEVVAVNDPALSDVCYARYLLTHDSVFVRFGKSVEVTDERTLRGWSSRRGVQRAQWRVGGRPIAVSSESDPARELGRCVGRSTSWTPPESSFAQGNSANTTAARTR